MRGFLFMLKDKNRVFIQIDGSNFYHRLKELKFRRLLNFDYQKFKEHLIGSRKLVMAKYYIGSIREEEGHLKSRILMKNQRKFLGSLQKNKWQIGLGHMLKTDRYREKGVDVLIAVDMIIGAYENLYDILILVSSDTDLLPAIDKVKKLGKKVEYIGFSHKPSYAMIANCNGYLFRQEDLENFLTG